MEKPTLIASVVILVVVLYNYSNLENSGVAYFSIFLCFAGIIFSIAKIKNPNPITNNEFESVEKEMDSLQNFNGIFRYEEIGFHFVLSEKKEFVKWDDIVEVNAFSISTGYRDRQSGIEVVTAGKKFEFNQKHISGIEKLSDQLYENLPHWNVDSPSIRINNYNLQKANQYKKGN